MAGTAESPSNTAPMDAEDVAAAAIPVDPASLPNGTLHSGS